MDPRARGVAGSADRLALSDLAPMGAPALNRRRGRLAQLVRASRLRREGRRFESVTAYQASLLTSLDHPVGHSAQVRRPSRVNNPRPSERLSPGTFDSGKLMVA